MTNGQIIEVLLVVAYLLPTIVSWRRGHRQHLAITVLNVLLGWTILGWIGALVWACTTDVEPKIELERSERIRIRPLDPWRALINTKGRNRT